jgi:Winged helix DNA-binding domain
MGAAERFHGQWLHRRRAPADAVVRHLLAVQAQEERSLRLALRARGAAGSPDAVVTSWLLRGTLHTVLREDFWWLHALCAPRLATGNRRRLAQLGVSEDRADRAVGVIRDALAGGPLPRAALAELLEARGQAIVHLLMRAAIAGVVVLEDRAFALAGPRPAPPDRDAALRELGRRYLAAHAGADAADLAHWSGLPLGDARRALRDAAPPRAPRGPLPLRLVPAYDELLLGWRDRTPVVPAEHARRVHPGGGLLRAVVLEDGRAVGTWQLRGGRVTVEPFAEICDMDGLAGEIAAVEACRVAPRGAGERPAG